jgi:hypothetical protein
MGMGMVGSGNRKSSAAWVVLSHRWGSMLRVFSNAVHFFLSGGCTIAKERFFFRLCHAMNLSLMCLLFVTKVWPVRAI